jgi:hypothetical protein
MASFALGIHFGLDMALCVITKCARDWPLLVAIWIFGLFRYFCAKLHHIMNDGVFQNVLCRPLFPRDILLRAFTPSVTFLASLPRVWAFECFRFFQNISGWLHFREFEPLVFWVFSFLPKHFWVCFHECWAPILWRLHSSQTFMGSLPWMLSL